jgi:AcrR family transcriptional regulator
MSDQEIKRRIHEKALDHFLHFGFSKVTMNEIAEELGMSKKTLYQYFPSKEELLAAVVNKLQDDTATSIDSVVRDTSIDFVQKLRSALNLLAEFHARMTPHFMADLEKHAPEVGRCSNEFNRDRMRTIMSRLVTEGVQKGIFRGDINPEIIVQIYGGAVQNLLRPENLGRLALSVSDVHRIIGKVLIEGVLTAGARKNLFTESEEMFLA